MRAASAGQCRAKPLEVGDAPSTTTPSPSIVADLMGNARSAATTEHMKTMPPAMVQIDPDKIAARKAGASPSELHERVFTGEFAPAKPRAARKHF